MRHERASFPSFVPACVLAATLAFGAEALAAPILYLTQTRSVDAEATAAVPGASASDDDAATAPGFEAFAASIQPTAAVAPAATGMQAEATGAAEQSSTLGASTIAAFGQAGVSFDLSAGTGGLAAADAISSFVVEFRLIAAATYTLAGSVDTLATLTGGALLPLLATEVRLEYLDTATLLFATLTADESFSVIGQLAPGDYRLTALASATTNQPSGPSPRTGSGWGSFDLALTVTPTQVAEPGVLPLAFGALAALAAIRRRRAGR